MINKLLQIKHTLVIRWIREFGESLPEPQMTSETQNM
jgi:transposase-like protein